MPALSQPAIKLDASTQTIVCEGCWRVSESLEIVLSQIKQLPTQSKAVIDMRAVEQLDSVGVWVLSELIAQQSTPSFTPVVQGLSAKQKELFELISPQLKAVDSPLEKISPPDWITRLGKNSIIHGLQLVFLITFLGELTLSFSSTFIRKSKLQWASFLNTIYETGYRALPIIALLAALIGVVLTYQMGQQLKTYGANIYIVGLLGVGVLQEFGPLIAAIIVVGRTSSSFTAQLGTMQINQEIDALRTMGLAPMQYLVVPKVLGLLVAMPLLILWADIFGVLGGMLISKFMLGIGFYGFLTRFPATIELMTLFNGLIKAPVFALIIGSVGCFQGLSVEGGADSVGKQTTRSVVQAIFLIIIADAIFSTILPWQALS